MQVSQKRILIVLFRLSVIIIEKNVEIFRNWSFVFGSSIDDHVFEPKPWI